MILSSGMGESPLTWSEVKSFSEILELNLTPWQSEQLMTMSKVYLSSKSRYSNDNTLPAPYLEESEDAKQALRDSVAAKMKAAFSRS